MAVTSERVAAFLPMILQQARRYRGWNNAELDDLVQEGLIAVWVSLEKGIEPSAQFVGFRMKNWARLLGCQWSYELFREVWDEGVHNPGS